MNEKKYNLIEKIKDYLEIHGCALSIQILRNFDNDDAWYVSNCIQDLLEKNKLKRKLYRGSDFYYLPGNESEIKRKVRVVKLYIIKCVKEYGPLRAKTLVNKIRDNYDYDISSLIVYRLTKELKSDDEIDAVKVGPNNIFFEKGNREQANEARKIVHNHLDKIKLMKMSKLCGEFCLRINDDYSLSSEEKELLDNLYEEFEPFLLINVSGRSYKDLICALYFIFTKKKIFDLLKQQPTFEQLYPWLCISENLLDQKNTVFTGYRHKTFQFLVREIISKINFKDKKLIPQLLNTPDFNLRIKFLLHYHFNFDSNINDKFLNFIRNAILKGYDISGKSIKGIFGGAIYIVIKSVNLRMTQKEIANKLKITEVTLRSRTKELSNFI